MPRQTSDAPSLSAPAPKRMRAAALKADKPDISGDISSEEEEGERVVVSETALKNCVLCRDKEGRNLAGLWDVKYHYAVCYYNAGAMFEVVDAGDDNTREGGVVEPVQKFRYTCPFEKCSKNEGKVKTMGFKEYAIHCGHEHSMVEVAMAADEKRDMSVVVEALQEAREKEGKGGELLMPPVKVEEMHTCLLCKGKDERGKDVKEAQQLSFVGTKALTARYHYAQCYYGEGVYYSMYSPGEKNDNGEGRPVDVLGGTIKYSCEVKGCDATKKRKMGYKEFCIHTSNCHGGLLEVLRGEEREELRQLLPRFEALEKK